MRKDLEGITMGYIEDWLGIGNAEMESFTITWLLWTVDRDIANSDYCLASIARHLMKLSEDDWPRVPVSPGTRSEVIESLNYLRNKRPWGKDFDRVVADINQPGLAMWFLACAAAKEDRAPIPTYLKYSARLTHWQLSGVLSDYFQACGRKEDLKDLEKLHRIWLVRERRRTTSWEVSTSVFGDIEDAMKILRVRLLLTGE
ncbi:hypothetical protein N9A94_05900 [Akkermansiaceae bacterium]|nr:hypothetical protein [Akkermansiaceae bacterium]